MSAVLAPADGGSSRPTAPPRSIGHQLLSWASSRWDGSTSRAPIGDGSYGSTIVAELQQATEKAERKVGRCSMGSPQQPLISRPAHVGGASDWLEGAPVRGGLAQGWPPSVCPSAGLLALCGRSTFIFTASVAWPAFSSGSLQQGVLWRLVTGWAMSVLHLPPLPHPSLFAPAGRCA